MQTIYIEEAVAELPRTQEIVARYKSSNIITIERYTEVFNPKAQNFRVQKSNPALILAAKHDNHVLAAPPDYNIGGKHNYYFSHMMNCIYDCRYCFLQGMYSSANYVVFVNFDQFFSAIEKTSQVHRQAGNEDSWFFSGYDCDSLALDPVTGFTRECLDFFEKTPNVQLELRTKSTQIRHLLQRKPLDNCVVAYSLSPAAVAEKLEHKAPSLQKRVQALVKLQQAGWHIGLRFDPLMNADNFQELYKGLFEQVFSQLDCESIHSVSVGPFRLPRPFFKKLIRLYPDEPMLADTFSSDSSLVTYPDEANMIAWCSNQILSHVSAKQFFPCT